MLTHINAVTLRVKGSGVLISELFSNEDEFNQTLADYTMSLTTSKSKTLLANFIHEKACLLVKVNAIDAKFQIDRITIYTKPVATGYPQ